MATNPTNTRLTTIIAIIVSVSMPIVLAVIGHIYWSMSAMRSEFNADLHRLSVEFHARDDRRADEVGEILTRMRATEMSVSVLVNETQHVKSALCELKTYLQERTSEP